MFRFHTAGESHGPCVLTIIEGLPHGLTLDIEALNRVLARRQGGYGRGGRMKIEQDRVEVLAGMRLGQTIGAPLVLMVPNKDNRLDSAPAVTKVRPGHADLAGTLKFGLTDARDVLERASARETVARTLAGAVAGQFLAHFGVQAFGWVSMVGGVSLAGRPSHDLGAARAVRDASPMYSLDAVGDAEAVALVDQARANGDTLGGQIEIEVRGLVAGLGSFAQWNQKLDGQLAQACMSVQAMKAVEIGVGVAAASLPGSQMHDPIVPDQSGPRGTGRASNNAGGLEAGVTNGQPLRLRVTMKPIATLMRSLPTVDLASGQIADAARERSDVCAVPAASVVLENVVLVPLAEAMLAKFGGDSMAECLRHFHSARGEASA